MPTLISNQRNKNLNHIDIQIFIQQIEEILKSNSAKCQWGCEAKGALIYCQ